MKVWNVKVTASYKCCYCSSVICYVLWHYLLSCLGMSVEVSFTKTNYGSQENIQEVSTLSNSNDAEVPLMCSGSPGVVYKTSSVSLVSVVMIWEPLLFDEND